MIRTTSLFILSLVLLGIGMAYQLNYSVAHAAIIPPPPPPEEGDDSDADGIMDDVDMCLGTSNDPLPKENHYSWLGGETFSTLDPKTKTLVDSAYTIEETHGCSCAQILAQKPGGNGGEGKYGCTKGTMENFIAGTW